MEVPKTNEVVDSIGRGCTPEDFKVSIEWRLLQRIAEYYQFPSAVFLMPFKNFPKEKTREDGVLNNANEFREKLNALFEEYLRLNALFEEYLRLKSP
ncbi:MAG: hypothetical protein FJ241_13490 [Nitrospira sp.]|nr:hypothetical protein [Nitrospira sp.]